MRSFSCSDGAADLTRLAWRYSQIHKYDDEQNYLNIERDTSALSLCPDNAFAWVQLGSDLALLQQTDLAITATVEGLNRLPPWQDHRETRYRSQLHFVALLNLADYNVELEEYGAALDALAAIEKPENLDAFRRLAYYFRDTEAEIGLKDAGRAKSMLELARAVHQDELDSFPAGVMGNYPQYFWDVLREANLLYLDGQIKLVIGKPQEADVAFKEALQHYQWHWEAQFALANTSVAEGDLETAIKRYERLLRVAKEKMVIRTERIAFNLGNARYSQGKWDLAAKDFKRAVEIKKHRSRRFRKHVERLLHESALASVVKSVLSPGLEQEEEIFPEAYNNLGNCYVQIALRASREGEKGVAVSRGDANASSALEEAEAAFKEALKSNDYPASYVAYANLGHVYKYLHRYELFIQEMEHALTLTPGYREALEELYQVAGSNAMNLEKRLLAYNVVLDALAESGPRRYVVERFGTWIENIERLCDANLQASSMAARAKAKVLHLKEQDAEALAIYNNSGSSDAAVWRSVGLAQLRSDAKTGSKDELERLLSGAIREIEQGPGEGRWTLADVRDAYLLRARVRYSLGDVLGANTDSGKALKLAPRAEADHRK